MTIINQAMELPLISKRETTLLHEHLGLSLGLKKASIFYVPFEKLEQYAGHFRGQGYHVENSAFSYTYDKANAHIHKHSDSPNSWVSIYISKEENTSKRLKHLDHLQQTKSYMREGTSGSDIFFEIAGLLGYPKCCSTFLQEMGEGRSFFSQRQGLGTFFSNETFYPMLALSKSPHVSSLLNNFSEAIPSLISFHVCRYDCPHAISIAKAILQEAIKENYSTPEKLGMLSVPLLFFSPRETIFLPHATRRANVITYDAKMTAFHESTELVKAANDSLKRFYSSLLQGDSIVQTDSELGVYSKGSLIGVKKKTHAYDGVFVSFDS
jgi:hypothetical protein